MRCANARFILVGAVTSLLGTAVLQAAQSNADAAPATDSTADASGDVLDTVVVTAQRLNEKRAGIETQTGAPTYTTDDAASAATPGGTAFSTVTLNPYSPTFSLLNAKYPAAIVFTSGPGNSGLGYDII